MRVILDYTGKLRPAWARGLVSKKTLINKVKRLKDQNENKVL